MKYLILTLAFLCLNTPVFSQDSMSIRTEIDTFSTSNYEGQFDYVFARKEVKKQLFKLGGKIADFELAYERKLTKDFSINFSLNSLFGIGGFLSSTSGSRDSLLNLFSVINSLKFGIEPRWYYSMKKDIKNGLISDNLNGNYIGLRMRTGSITTLLGRKYKNSNTSIELTWGMQRRVLRNQFFDFSIGAGLNRHSNIYNEFGSKRNQNERLLNYRFTYGFILDKNLFKDREPNCDALRCFEEEKSLWKKSINNIGFINDKGKYLNLSIAYEHKIDSSQWSLDMQLSPYIAQLEIGGIKSKLSGVSFQLTPRCYWTLNKRIAKGESGNNLSGKYFGLSLNIGQNKNDFSVFNNAINADYKTTFTTLSITPILGYQKRLLTHLYLDVNAGYGVSNSTINIKRDGRSYSVSSWIPSPVTNFTFGVCF